MESILRFEAMDTLCGRQALDMAVFDSAGASLFLTKAHSEKTKRKLQNKLRDLEMGKVGHRWTRDCIEFKAALEKLRDRKVVRCVRMMVG